MGERWKRGDDMEKGEAWTRHRKKGFPRFRVQLKGKEILKKGGEQNAR